MIRARKDGKDTITGEIDTAEWQPYNSWEKLSNSTLWVLYNANLCLINLVI